MTDMSKLWVVRESPKNTTDGSQLGSYSRSAPLRRLPWSRRYIAPAKIARSTAMSTATKTTAWSSARRMLELKIDERLYVGRARKQDNEKNRSVTSTPPDGQRQTVKFTEPANFFGEIADDHRRYPQTGKLQLDRLHDLPEMVHGREADIGQCRPRRHQVGRSEQHPTQNDEVKRQHDADAPPQPISGASREQPLDPPLHDQQHAVIDAPQDKRPVGAMPQPAQAEDRHYIENPSSAAHPVAAERDV